MCSQNLYKYITFLAVLVFLAGCGVMDSIMPSGATYRVNARVNDLPIDELSIVSANAKIQPYFDNTVSNDPDVTALIIFLRNSRGDIAGWKVVYTADADNENVTGQESPRASGYETGSNENTNINDPDGNLKEENENNNSKENETVHAKTPQKEVQYRNSDQLIIRVKSLDNDLPYFPIPPDLPMGRYTLVSQVMSEDQILHKTEKTFYFLANVKFSFDGINVHHSGINENNQLISQGKIIMLEAKLDYDSRLDPYIVWYNGRRIISEGNFSQGAGNLLWKTPEQTGFSSIRAEIFPVTDRLGLAGFVKDISLLISPRVQDMHYISEDSADLLHWYLLEGNLNDVKMNGGSSKDHALKAEYLNLSSENLFRWMPANGIFGLAAGINNAYSLPDVSFPYNADNGYGWRILGRFKPLNSGIILSVQFGASSNVLMSLNMDGNNLVLSLSSPSENVSKIYNLSLMRSPDREADSFITAEINFSILADHLSAQLNVIFDNNPEHHEYKDAQPISIEAEYINKFKITLGSQSLNKMPEYTDSVTSSSAFTALWDEVALFYKPYVKAEITDNENAEPEKIYEKEAAGEKKQTKPETEKQTVEDNPFIAEIHPVSGGDPYLNN